MERLNKYGEQLYKVLDFISLELVKGN